MRRPSGDVSWMCRVQNGSLNSDSVSEFPLADLTAIFQPSMEPAELLKLKNDAKINVEKLDDEEYTSLLKTQNQVTTQFQPFIWKFDVYYSEMLSSVTVSTKSFVVHFNQEIYFSYLSYYLKIFFVCFRRVPFPFSERKILKLYLLPKRLKFRPKLRKSKEPQKTIPQSRRRKSHKIWV